MLAGTILLESIFSNTHYLIWEPLVCITYVFFSIEAPGALLTLLLSLSFFLQVWSKRELLFLHYTQAKDHNSCTVCT